MKNIMLKNIWIISTLLCMISLSCIFGAVASSDNTLILEKSSKVAWPLAGHVRTPPPSLFLALQMTEQGVIAFSKNQFYEQADGTVSYSHSYSHFKMPHWEWFPELTRTQKDSWQGSEKRHVEFIQKNQQTAALWRQKVGEKIVGPQAIALSYTTDSGDKLAVITPQFQSGYPRTEHGLPETNILRVYALTAALCKQPRSPSLQRVQDATRQPADKSSETKE